MKNSFNQSFRKLVTIFTLMILCVAIAPHTASARNGCFGASCRGKDPQATGCSRDAVTLARAWAGFVQVELRFSRRCNARWARSTQFGGDFPATMFAALGSGFVTGQTGIGRVWSLMWTGPIRACGGLAPLQSGFRACTVAR